ncbi:MAG TPA: glutamate 5-kinase, partial [Kiritimatiellae bacterium]|nr:glutamate 5-kinase [Kiritimatiellia bacterium]
VVLVSSGAIGCGMAALGMRRRPQSLPELQTAAAVGQTRLMAAYQRVFGRYRVLTAQLLLTHDDLRNRQRHLNARNTLMTLLRRGAVPIVNENDVVAVDEIKVGDNDFLAALVAMLIGADLLVLLTTTNGIRRPRRGGRRTDRVPVIRSLTPELRRLVGRHKDHLSVGGMATKLEAAQMAAAAGIPTVIADGRRKRCLQEICSGAPVGTLVIADRRRSSMPARKRWIAFFHRPQGALVVDEGARDALRRRGRSLLPIGVREVRGDFPAGAVVDILDPRGNLVGRGLVGYSSQQIRLIRGRPTGAIQAILGTRDYDEVIHRDNMMLFDQQEDQ